VPKPGRSVVVDSETEAFATIVAGLDTPAYVVTVAAGAERGGCLVGFTTQCSIEPPRFGVWLSKENRTYRLAVSAATLVVHLLRRGDRDLARLFGATTGDAVDKFKDVEWRPGPDGCPVLVRCAGSPAPSCSASIPETTSPSCWPRGRDSASDRAYRSSACGRSAIWRPGIRSRGAETPLAARREPPDERADRRAG
jgi:hypothetical protein